MYKWVKYKDDQYLSMFCRVEFDGTKLKRLSLGYIL